MILYALTPTACCRLCDPTAVLHGLGPYIASSVGAQHQGPQAPQRLHEPQEPQEHQLHQELREPQEPQEPHGLTTEICGDERAFLTLSTDGFI